MISALLDSSYLKALINAKDNHHKTASDISEKIRACDQLYVPYPVFIDVMNHFDFADNNTQEMIAFIIHDTTVVFNVDKTTYVNALKNYCKSDYDLNFTDYICIEYMKKKKIHNILSFKEEFDKIEEVQRLEKSDFSYQNTY